jgi:hypothetical protein
VIDFFEFIALKQKPRLPDSLTMMRKLSIDPEGPDEIQVMKMVKQMKKQAAALPIRGSGPGLSSPPRSGPTGV